MVGAIDCDHPYYGDKQDAQEIQPVEIPEIQDKLDSIEKIADENEYEPTERLYAGSYSVIIRKC